MTTANPIHEKPLQIPDVVARYLRYAIPGNRRIRSAIVRQEGEFRLGNSGQHWRAFEATERFDVDRPAFEWDAEIRLAPLMTIRVRDTYRDGVGSTTASLLGRNFMTARRSPELDHGALQRYLAEAVWLPPVLVGGNGICWRGLDLHRAIATLEDGSLKVALQFSFNERGEVTEIYAPARPRQVAGAYAPTPWLVRCWDYLDVNGFRVPARSEVSWVLPEGRFTYWKGHVREVTYEWAADDCDQQLSVTAAPSGLQHTA